MNMPAEILSSNVTLDRLLQGIADAPAMPIAGIASDSRKLGKGDLFIALQGRNSHGLEYLDHAIEAGVAAVIWDPGTADGRSAGVPLIAVPGLAMHRRLLARGVQVRQHRAEWTRAEIFSVGHRDVSGLAVHPDTGETWMTEHGPRGGDELNRIVPGANYGWKAISYGTDYDGTIIGDGSGRRDGMQQPLYFWRPSIAPSGLVFYTADLFPEWRGNAFVTALSGQHISRLVLDGDRVVGEERLLVERGERIRELRVGPDGALYALTNEEADAPKGTAELLRIAPP